jgi:hypothetical protein
MKHFKTLHFSVTGKYQFASQQNFEQFMEAVVGKWKSKILVKTDSLLY